MISSVVYPQIDGHNKQRLTYIYNILSACYFRLSKGEEQAIAALTSQYRKNKKHNLEPHQFYKVLEQECQRVSFIKELDFKNIAGLDDLNFNHFNKEISVNIHESTVEALADMVRTLLGTHGSFDATGGLISWQSVYKHYIQSCLDYLKSEVDSWCISTMSPDKLQEVVEIIELKYDSCRKYIVSLAEADRSWVTVSFCVLCIPPSFPWKSNVASGWRNCLALILCFWIKVLGDEASDTKVIARCVEVLNKLLMEGEISADSGWNTIIRYVKLGFKDGLHTDISNFLQAMIFLGCGFKFVANVYYGAELNLTSLNSNRKVKTLVDLYIYLTEKALVELSRGHKDHHDLLHLLSSLSRLEDGGYVEDFKMIRSRVWGNLSCFSDDMQLKSHLRVFALELMQAITGQNLASLPDEVVSVVQPWEGWEISCSTASSRTAEESADVSGNNITSTLAALKSMRLVASFSPDAKIAPEDLTTLDSAISCFLQLSEKASSLPDVHVLRAVLEEWEVQFSSSNDKEKVAASPKSPAGESTGWSGDEWDNEGWENLPDDELLTGKKAEGKNNSAGSVLRPLHSCWMEIVKKLVELSEFGAVIEMLDGAADLLLDEHEARRLYKLVVEIDCFLALKMLLLLPYKEPQLQCLRAVETRLRDERCTPDENGHGLLTLVLSSGVIKDIARDPTLGKLFSYLCQLVGYLARRCQEELVKHNARSDQRFFSTVLFPCFVSELVEAGQCLLAGFVVSKWMHSHSSLGLIDTVVPSLRKYLEGQLLAAGEQTGDEELESCSLVHSRSRLRGRVGSMVESAISALPADTQRRDFV